MKILYDYQILIMQKYGGISRYFYELAVRIKERGEEPEVRTLFSKNSYFQNYFKIKRISPDQKYKIPGLIRICHAVILLQPARKYDIIHPTYYDTYLIGKFKGKLVITVHDMIHEKYIQHDRETIKRKREYIYKSDKIIAISECTKKDILHYYPDIPEDKIRVIYQASDIIRKKTALNFLPSKYILYVGNREGYKNFIRFVYAVRPLVLEDTQLQVVCAGGGAFQDDEMQLLKDLKMDSRFLQYSYTEKELFTIYSTAALFVFPSLYEGFGIPLLESMQSGCPVVCSNTSCFPEIAGDAALYFHPEDIQDMTRNIKEVYCNASLKKELVKKGKIRMQMFSWDRTAQETQRLYKDCLEMKK